MKLSKDDSHNQEARWRELCATYLLLALLALLTLLALLVLLVPIVLVTLPCLDRISCIKSKVIHAVAPSPSAFVTSGAGHGSHDGAPLLANRPAHESCPLRKERKKTAGRASEL